MHKRGINLPVLTLISFLFFIFISMGSAEASTNTFTRLWGDNRYKTGVSISQNGWPGGSNYVILARGDEFPDALCAVPLAKEYNAPILLTEPGDLNADAYTEIRRLGAANVIIIGGYKAVSQEAEKTLNDVGINTERIYGEDRYETSVKIAERLGSFTSAAIATGLNFPDALSISSIASSKGMPILLTMKDKLSDSAKKIIADRGVTKTYIIGGPSAVSDDIVNSVPGGERLSGSDRFDTNLMVLNKFIDNLKFDNIYLAVADGPNGDEFADALSGSALAAKSQAPVVLVYNSITSPLRNFVRERMTDKTCLVALGGEKAVPQVIINDILGTIKPVYNITKDAYYDGIQSAVDNASSGDTIKIASGTYVEHLDITKDNIKLIGADRDTTIIDATQDGSTTRAGIRIIGHSGVEIRNLTVKNAGVKMTYESSREPYGIYVSGGDKNIFDNLNLQNNGECGIYLTDGCDLNTVENCTIDGAGADTYTGLDGIFSSGGGGTNGGISFMNTYNKFINNTIKNVVYGISLTASSSCEIWGNQIHAKDSASWTYSVSACILLSNSSNNLLKGNTIDSSQYGIRLSIMSSPSPYAYAGNPNNNDMEENSITALQYGIRVIGTGNKANLNTINGSSGTTGIWLADSASSTDITYNVISGNGIGILADNASNSAHYNRITGSTVGLKNNTAGTFDATKNWWGTTDASGRFSGSVSCSPWLGDGNDSSSSAGFQLDSPMVWYTTGPIDQALGLASSGDTIHLVGGTYSLSGQLYIDKNITVAGEGKDSSIIKIGFDTSNVGDSMGAILVKPGATLNLQNLSIDGSGRKVMDAVRVLGSFTASGIEIRNIYYAKYQGFGIYACGSANMDVKNSSFSAIEKAGIGVYENAKAVIGGEGVSDGNTFTGSGSGDYIQYAVHVSSAGGNPSAVITNNKMGGFSGSATSSGVFIESGNAALSGNELNDSIEGIRIYTGSTVNNALISGDNAASIGDSILSGCSGNAENKVRIYNSSDLILLYPAPTPLTQ